MSYYFVSWKKTDEGLMVDLSENIVYRLLWSPVRVLVERFLSPLPGLGREGRPILSYFKGVGKGF